MNEFYQAKFNELFLEFNRYLIMNPDFGKKFPPEAEVILLDRRDAGYTSYMLDSVPKGEENIVFVDVGELAPIHSRLKNPKIISRPHAAV